MSTTRDPRHGTVNGYNNIPCDEECCRAALRRYQALRTLYGTRSTISSLGTKRRIQALMALGWTRQAIGEAAGYAPGAARARISQILRGGDTMYIQTARKIEKAYAALSMRIPTGNTQVASIIRRNARRNGWPPPLAWNNIDDPNEQPVVDPVDDSDRIEVGSTGTEVDEVLAIRILEGNGSVAPQATRTERLVIIHRWIQTGRSQGALEELTGWNVSRLLRWERDKQQRAKAAA